MERLRDLAAELLAISSDGVALVPATSYGLASVAANLGLQPGQRVLVLDQEYPSNYYTWQRHTRRSGAEVVVVAREAGQDWADAILAAIDERVAVVAVPNVHWTDGAIVDLAAVASATHAVGASLVIDASQSLGVMPLDLTSLRPAAVVAVGYKWLLGPFSLGYLYVAEHLREGEPLEENWINRAGSEDFAALVDYSDTYRPGARRFDVGQRTNFGLVPMAIAALEQLLHWGVDRIGATLAATTADLAEQVSTLGPYLPLAPERRGPHILGLEIPPESGPRILDALRQADVNASIRGSALRLSPHLHTSDQDLHRLITALKTVH